MNDQNTSGLVRNLPSPEGAALGEQLARFADNAFAKSPEAKERCNTCAFRKGTIPNQCLPTAGDALKCLVEGEEFHCHEREGEKCAGYAILNASASPRIGGAIELPWEFSQ